MFRVLFFAALTLGIAFGGGIASAWYALSSISGLSAIRLGPWQARPDAYTGNADPYALAHRARTGELPLGGAEGLRFSAVVDSAGLPLTARCSYVVAGQTPISRIWTLHAQPVPEDGADRASSAIHSRQILRRGDGSFRIAISPTIRPGNWLPLNGSGPFRLHLTLYDTPAAGSLGLLEIEMPQIRRESCRND